MLAMSTKHERLIIVKCDGTYTVWSRAVIDFHTAIVLIMYFVFVFAQKKKRQTFLLAQFNRTK